MITLLIHYFISCRMSEHAFETVRILAVVSTMGMKLFIMPWYLQAYLDMAYHRVEEQKKEAGRITNRDFQKKVAAVFYYLCVVTLQYVAPIIICLYLTLMYKSLGGYSWNGLFIEPPNNMECLASDETPQVIDPFTVTSEESSGTITQSAQEFHLALENLKSVS